MLIGLPEFAGVLMASTVMLGTLCLKHGNRCSYLSNHGLQPVVAEYVKSDTTSKHVPTECALHTVLNLFRIEKVAILLLLPYTLCAFCHL